MDVLRSRILDSDVILIYEQFMRQTLVPVIIFSAEQLDVINSFLDIYNKKHIKTKEIDMMSHACIFETMKRFIM